MEESVVPVTAAIISRGHEVLIAKRPPGGRHPGYWEFPGGKVEENETAEESLAREMIEEMGLRVQVGNQVAAVRYDYLDLKIDLLAFECEIIEGEPEYLHCEAHAWVETERLLDYDLLPPDRELARILF